MIAPDEVIFASSRKDELREKTASSSSKRVEGERGNRVNRSEQLPDKYLQIKVYIQKSGRCNYNLSKHKKYHLLSVDT